MKGGLHEARHALGVGEVGALEGMDRRRRGVRGGMTEGREGFRTGKSGDGMQKLRLRVGMRCLQYFKVAKKYEEREEGIEGELSFNSDEVDHGKLVRLWQL